MIPKAPSERLLLRIALPMLLLLVLAGGPAAAVDRVVIEEPLVSPTDPEHRERLLALLDRAAALSGRTYGQRIEVTTTPRWGGAALRPVRSTG